MEKYGREYKDARKEKMESMAVPIDEITRSSELLETHHSQPKMFDGPDVKENLIVLCRDFHAYIHQICNVKNNELIYKRLAISKQIRKDPNGMAVEGQKKRLDELDEILMKEYIENMVMNLGQNYRDKVLKVTHYSQMQTIKTQAIKILQLEDKIRTLESHNKFKK